MRTYAVTVTRFVIEEATVYVEADSHHQAGNIAKGAVARATGVYWERVQEDVKDVSVTPVVPERRAHQAPSQVTLGVLVSGTGTRPTVAGAKA